MNAFEDDVVSYPGVALTLIIRGSEFPRVRTTPCLRVSSITVLWYLRLPGSKSRPQRSGVPRWSVHRSGSHPQVGRTLVTEEHVTKHEKKEIDTEREVHFDNKINFILNVGCVSWVEILCQTKQNCNICGSSARGVVVCLVQ